MPKINQLLTIQIASLDEEDEKQLYRSRIADIDEDHLWIELPINSDTGKLKRLYLNDSLSLHYITEGGVKNYFNSEVTGFRQDNVPLVKIVKPDLESITKVQRRNYLRVPASQEIAVNISSEHLQFTTLTVDLSGGGLSFICEATLPVKEQQKFEGWLLLQFKTGAIEHAQLHAEIIRVKKLESGKLLVMARYTDIKNADRQKIVRYCFERQLDFRNG